MSHLDDLIAEHTPGELRAVALAGRLSAQLAAATIAIAVDLARAQRVRDEMTLCVVAQAWEILRLSQALAEVTAERDALIGDTR